MDHLKIRAASRRLRQGLLPYALTITLAVLLVGTAPASAAQVGYSASAPYHPVVLKHHNNLVTWSNGVITIAYTLNTGLSSYVWNKLLVASNADIEANVQGYPGSGSYGHLQTTDYALHTYATIPIDDQFGPGTQIQLINTDPRYPSLTVFINLYDTQSFLLIWGSVTGQNNSTVAANAVYPLVVAPPVGTRKATGKLSIGSTNPANLVLHNGFGNYSISQYVQAGPSLSNVSYWVGALTDPATSYGVVAGSVTNDTWKSGVIEQGNRNGGLSVFALDSGVTIKDDDTQSTGYDKAPYVSGTQVSSEKFIFGYYADIHAGLEQYAAVSAQLEPPITWNGPAPMGWGSYGYYRNSVTEADALKQATYMAQNLASLGYSMIQLDNGWEEDWGDWVPNPVSLMAWTASPAKSTRWASKPASGSPPCSSSHSPRSISSTPTGCYIITIIPSTS